MTDSHSGDTLVSIAWFVMPVIIAFGLSIYALYSKKISNPTLFVFKYTILGAIPCSMIIGFVADAISSYQMSAGVLMIFFEPPVATLVAGIAAVIVWLIDRRRTVLE